jgi:hypothetical protein
MSLKNTTQYCRRISFKHWLLHYPLKSPKWPHLFRFPKETLYSRQYYMHATWQCFIFLGTIILIISGEQKQTWSSLQSLLHPYISTSISHQIFSSQPSSHKTLNLRSCHDVRHQTSHPNSMTVKMSVLYISTCNILNWIATSIASNYPPFLSKITVLLKFRLDLTYLKSELKQSKRNTSEAMWHKTQTAPDIP